MFNPNEESFIENLPLLLVLNFIAGLFGFFSVSSVLNTFMSFM